MIDVIVIGAGAWGLWAAWFVRARGFSVTVIDRAGVGAGASGGPVGVLAPHGPDRWSAKKAVQLDALMTLGPALATAAAAGGGDPGYARVGRIQPLASEGARATAVARLPEARARWSGFPAGLRNAGGWPGWLDPAAAPHGVLWDGLTARLDPAATCGVLARALVAVGADLRQGLAATGIAPGVVATPQGALRARAIVVAAGAESFPLLAATPAPVAGGPVKGQALRIPGAGVPGAPVLYDDGVYLVTHGDGALGLGSTSEPVFDDPATTDHRLADLRVAGERLCPALRGAPAGIPWAGLRPRAHRADARIGPVPGLGGVYACTGGYKIGLALGHWAGARIAAMISGETVELPPGFGMS